jgi:4-oxalocrotonate tautomerase
MNVSDYGEKSLFVAMEEVRRQDWREKVYKPDIVNNSQKLHRKPRYAM